MTPERPQALAVRGLTAGYRGRAVLHRLTLPPLVPGELAVLVGPNAAGKSTLLHTLANLVPGNGTVTFGDRDLARLDPHERARLIGFMPQGLPGGVGLTVVEGVIVALRATRNGSKGRDMIEEAFDVLARLGIADLAMQRLDRLSGGQRQLASLAQAVSGEPPILILDEPTSALDPARQFQILRLVKDYARGGRIAMIVLHDLAAAARWADRLIVLDQGRLHSAGTPQEVLTPAMLAEVYGVAARVEATASGHLCIEIDDCLRLPAASFEMSGHKGVA
ncbi:ABC transporter ATP-binding protein [Shinella sp. BYT-45]|uniref:ABC transporter ATP-binding protein n=1 Tax=Shinella sp. BYT-45 TaxID=3377377 RepID=UPI00397F4C6D